MENAYKTGVYELLLTVTSGNFWQHAGNFSVMVRQQSVEFPVFVALKTHSHATRAADDKSAYFGLFLKVNSPAITPSVRIDQ